MFNNELNYEFLLCGLKQNNNDQKHKRKTAQSNFRENEI